MEKYKVVDQRDFLNTRILLVEDSYAIALVTSMQLKELGYQVAVSHSYKDAVKVFESTKPFDIVLMDIDLGYTKDGFDLALFFQERSDVPIIFLSSQEDPQIILRAELISGLPYVHKWCSINWLSASIKSALQFGPRLISA